MDKLFQNSVHNHLYRLGKGNASVNACALKFCTLAASSIWNETALITAFHQGLNTEEWHQMVIYDDIICLEGFIQQAIRISQCLTACSLDKPAPHPLPTIPFVALPAPEPMEIDSYHITHAERQKRILNQLCIVGEI